MNSNIEKIEKSQVKITITLNAEEWHEMNVAAYNKTKNKYPVQGFRKGKAPMKVLQNTYGEGVFYEEAINEAFVKYYYDILEKNEDIFPVGQPDLDVENISVDGITLVAKVPIKPEVELGQYKGIKFEKIEYNVKDADVKKALEKKREDAGRMVDVEGRAAENGDTANIDFEGSVDGVKFDGGTAQGYDLVLGSKSFIPGFEEGVVGMNVGEEKDIPVTFPEDYGEKTLAGKAAVFKVKLNSLQVKELPELDDEFAKDVSEFDTLKELKKDIKAKLTEENERRATYEMEDKMLETIVESSKMELPDALIESQIDHMMQDFNYRLMYQGMNIDTYLHYTGTKMEDFRNSFRDEAIKSCKAQLVIDKLINVENIKAEDSDIDEEIKPMAENAKKSLEEYKKGLNPEQLDYISRNVIIKKLFDLLRKENTIE